jgi:hypothetical protein
MNYLKLVLTLQMRLRLQTTQGQEVKFHEIEIQLFRAIEFLIMRSKFNLFMRSNLPNKINQEVDTSIMRSKLKKKNY